jgi:surface carbohydrate biosynthesis protein
MRRLYIVSAKELKDNIDVIIVDETGSEWIQYCIPQKLNTFTLKTRGVIPLIPRLTFVWNLIRRFCMFGATSMTLMTAIIDTIKPKVIISHYDARIYGKLDNLYAEIAVISVQNALRSSHPFSTGDWGRGDTLPSYYAFGQFEASFFNKRGVVINDFHVVGSLKLGIFLSEFNKGIHQTNQKLKQICYISQYRHEFCDSTNPIFSEDSAVQLHAQYCKKSYALLVNWAERNNYTVVVAIANVNEKYFDSEIEFFKTTIDSDSVRFEENYRNKLSSYKHCIESEAIVTLDSTLGFELLGASERVLFTGSVDRQFLEKWGAIQNFKEMPEEITLSCYTQVDFDKKLNNLLELTDDSYREITRSAREYYMNCSDRHPHEVVKKHIEEHCELFRQLK